MDRSARSPYSHGRPTSDSYTFRSVLGQGRMQIWGECPHIRALTSDSVRPVVRSRLKHQGFRAETHCGIAVADSRRKIVAPELDRFISLKGRAM